jgi:hypothetical protein
VKDHLTELVRAARTPVEGRNVAREYLQARLLEGLQRAGAMIPLAFHGGTALRFLHRIPRYSEDLDFALERESDAYDLERFVRVALGALDAEGYATTSRLKRARTVHSAWLRFPGLLHELDLSSDAREILAVKLEVDTDPPAGAVLATTVTRRHVLLNLQHHDRASLLAGKVHALLERPYVKGRDVFDLAWYLADPTWPGPNLTLLANALRQTGHEGPTLDETGWRHAVGTRLRAADPRAILDDVTPFLEPHVDRSVLRLDNLLALLER